MDDNGRALRQLRVDLEQLAMALEDASGEINLCLDSATGEVILLSIDIELDAEIEADESGRCLAASRMY